MGAYEAVIVVVVVIFLAVLFSISSFFMQLMGMIILMIL